MDNRMKTGAAALTLAALISGCAPVPGTTPQAGATTGDYNGYTSYGTTGTNTNTSTNYGYNTGTNTNTSYYDYGTGSASSTATTTTTPGYDYSAGGSYGTGGSTSSTGSYGSTYYDYNSSGSSGTASNSVGGAYAVQVVASPNRSTADAMVSQMQSMGFNAVVDNVGGYNKVRVPFNSESEAKANLGRIRSSVPDAFYTVR